MFLLVAYEPSRYDRRRDEYTSGVFVCEEIETAEAVESHIEKILAERDLDDDEFSVYEIVPVLDEDGDRCWSSSIAERFVKAARPRVVAAKQAETARVAAAQQATAPI